MKREPLFLLIKSLTKSEKRQIKLSSKIRAGNKNYVKLFDILSNMKDYDEAEVKRQIDDADFLKSLSRNKNYLYNFILDIVFNLNEGETFQYLKRIGHIRVLQGKGLYSDAERLLKKMISRPNRNTQLYKMLLLESEREIKWGILDNYGGGGNDKTVYNVEEYYSRYFEEVEILKETKYHLQFQDKIIQLSNIFGEGMNKEERPIEKYIAEQKDNIKHNRLPKDLEIVIYNSLMAYFFLNREKIDKAEVSFYANLFIDHMEHLSSSIVLAPQSHLTNWGNIIVVSTSFRLVDTVKRCLDILEHIIVNYKGNTQTYQMTKLFWIHRSCSSYEMQNDHQGLLAYLESQKEFIFSLNEGGELLNLHYIAIQSCVNEKNYKNALDWSVNLSEVINSLKERDGYTLPYNLVSMIIHFKLGNTLLLESFTRKVKRALLKSKKSEQYAVSLSNTLIDFVTKPKQQFEKKNKESISLLMKSTKSKESLEFNKNFDFEKWLKYELKLF